jgi:RNA 2',3'-cyclic 3'-phosphodiesterase
VIRTFLAITPSAQVLENVEAFQNELRETGADVRWVAPSAMHLTIQFLGDVREAEMPGIERALVDSYRDQPPISIECRAFGVFPNLKKPRTLWAGIHGDGIAELAEHAEIALAPLGFPPEERDLRPHITLGRLRSTRGWEKLAGALKTEADRSFGACAVDRVILFKSDLRQSGPIYTPITELALAGALAG